MATSRSRQRKVTSCTDCRRRKQRVGIPDKLCRKSIIDQRKVQSSQRSTMQYCASVRAQAPEFLKLCLRSIGLLSDQLRLSWTRNTLYQYSNHSLARYINRFSTEPDGSGIEFNNSYSGPIILSYRELGLSQLPAINKP